MQAKKKVQLVEKKYFIIYLNMNKFFRILKIHLKHIWNIFKFNNKNILLFHNLPKKYSFIFKNTYLKAYMKTKESTLAWGRRVNGSSGWALGQQLLGADVERTRRWSDCRVRATGLSSENSIERETQRERERGRAGGVGRKRKDSEAGFFA